MNFDCIITQGHIPDYDPQGDLCAEDKRIMFNASLKHLRMNNPNAYIILSGHGVCKPDTSYCDWVYWEPKCRPMHANGYVINLPAQYEFVDIGLEQAQAKGFESCLKTRTDCIIQRKDITNWCQDILKKEDRKILLTQQTGHDRIGDCFMYGNVSDMRSIWNRNNIVHSPDGLLNTAFHFAKTFPRQEGHSWLEYVREHASFVDVIDIPFLCLRWNFYAMVFRGELDKLFTNSLNVNLYHWGKVNMWHAFDTNGNMIMNCNSAFWSKKDFYEQTSHS